MYHNNIFLPRPPVMFPIAYPIIRPRYTINQKSSVIIEEVFTEENDIKIKNDSDNEEKNKNINETMKFETKNNDDSDWIVIKRGTFIIRILNNNKLDEFLSKSFDINYINHINHINHI